MINNVIPDKIIVAVDTIILAIGKDNLEVMLVKLKNEPYEDYWALPGSVVQIEESLDDAAKRVLKERVGDGRLHIEQLYCFGNPKRDARGRSISVAYFALLREQGKVEPKLSGQYKEIGWFSVDKLPKMAFDHSDIVALAKVKLAYKLDEKEIVRTLLPEKFTLGELQKVHEVLSNKEIDKRNFAKKIKADGDIVRTTEIRTGGAFRPARLFRFK